ncbi:hypothetical protein [Paenibacillus radicis (ex Xue et al. 2023)]|uniref:HTH cro/C1-type domain-containing protein n=1 Tax=Paenibacillus radicis (ex Xue et al. 2023) TaxID=2972489 RepID=A0ABT1YTX0_9BACL|nr:hypothetical protein [Paenibacillus radicis (ex Xue et al. 2023)]MCR8636632.1 hypothetical protein [Paenibacillus radicis (ex Xue et al. 2023)]
MRLSKAIANPSLDTLLAIKKKFKCSIDDLVSDVENNLGYSLLSEEEVLLLKLNKSLTQFDRKEVLEIIKLKIELRKMEK